MIFVFRYKCGTCNFKAHDFITVSDHYKETHSKDLKPNVKLLTPDCALEKYVDKVLQFQLKEIKKYQGLTDINCDSLDEVLPVNEIKEEVNVIPPEDLLVASSSTIIRLPDKMYKCNKCSYEAKTSKILRTHKTLHNKPVKCNLCLYKGQQISNLKMHFRAKHPNMPLDYTMLESGVKRKRKSMDSDESLSPPKKSLPEGKKSVTPVVDDALYACMHCSKSFKDLDLLKLHFVYEHCGLRNKFLKYKKLGKNKAVTSGEYLHKCKYCDFSGDSKSVQSHHLTTHPNLKCVAESLARYLCKFCGFSTTKGTYMPKHLKSHKQPELVYTVTHSVTEGEPVIEEICLITDESVISSTIPTFYRCLYCNDDPFSDLVLLQEHHTERHSHFELNINRCILPKYKCPQDYCDFGSNGPNEIKDHIRTHSKRFKCFYCPMDYSARHVLHEHHVKTHSDMEFKFVTDDDSNKVNKELKDNLLILRADGSYKRIKDCIGSPKRTGTKRPATEPFEHPEVKVQAVDPTPIPVFEPVLIPDPVFILDQTPVRRVLNVARKSTAKPPVSPVRSQVAKKSTTPVKGTSQSFQGYSFYGTKPEDFNVYKNVTTEANLQGNKVRISVIGLQYVLKLFPKVLVQDIKKCP